MPRLLPAYNKFMGGVDRTDQLRMMYGCDRKSKCYWLRLFFQFFDYAVNNAYLLYKHGCIARNICPKDLLGFRLELVHVLLKVVGSKSGSTVQKKMKSTKVQTLGVIRVQLYSSIIIKFTPIGSSNVDRHIEWVSVAA